MNVDLIGLKLHFWSGDFTGQMLVFKQICRKCSNFTGHIFNATVK